MRKVSRRRLLAASFGPFLPNVLMGWDYRPTLQFPDQLFGRQTNPDWCVPASDPELVNAVREAVQQSRTSSADFPMRSIVLYAWNELSEGGWIVPTAREGTRRLEILSSALNRFRPPGKAVLRFAVNLGGASCGTPAPTSNGASVELPKACEATLEMWPCPAHMQVVEDRVTVTASGGAAGHEAMVERSCAASNAQ